MANENTVLAWRKIKVCYQFSPEKKSLTVKVHTWQDNFLVEGLLTFLQEHGITKHTEWSVEEIRDTDGLSFVEEIYTTVILRE